MADRELSRRQFIAGAAAAGVIVPATEADAQTSAAAALARPASAPASVQLSLTGTRTQLTTGEPVELALVYPSSAESLVSSGGSLTLEARHEDGSVARFDVSLGSSASSASSAPTERAHALSAPAHARIVTLPPGFLKPGAYALVAGDGSRFTASVELTVHGDEHPSAYFVAAWMQQTADPPTVLAKGGWMYFTSDLVAVAVRKPATGDVMERYVAARMKPYPMTVMGGGHQLDMDLSNDWSDPWVQRAVTWKMGLAALSDRIYPIAGLSAFDEPGLTWWPTFGADGQVAGTNPFTTPVQVEEFERLSGRRLPTGTLAETAPRYEGMMDAWIDFVALRLKYLEQAWWAAVTSVSQVHAPLTTINQVASSYASGLVTDGVDNRMNRPYQVLSGHGGYSDPFGSWGPVISARSYDGWSWDRPHYFLPMWGAYDYPRMRQEVWLPWSTKLEGIEYDPNHDWGLAGSYLDATAVLEIAEVNRRLALVGDVMTRVPRSLAPVAVLISHCQFARDIATVNHPKALVGWRAAYGSEHRRQVMATMWRALGTGAAPNWIDEYEVVAKGAAFLGQWKVVYCPGLAFAKPEFQRALEGYVAAGGRLVQGKDDPLQIRGSTRVGYSYAEPAEGMPRNDYALRKYWLDLAPDFAPDLRSWLGRRTFCSNAPLNAMLMSVHRAGEATYLLIANNNQDPENTRQTQIDPIPLETTIDVPPAGVLYDLLNGGNISAPGGRAPLRLAAGDGACWLHLPAPVGPLNVSVEPAALAWALDVTVTWGTAGYLPFRLRVKDPAGAVALELFRATTPPGAVPLSSAADLQNATVFRHRVALGANATPGVWTVEAHEWLTGSVVRASVRVGAPNAAASVSTGKVSVYFEDEKKIVSLLAGHPREPPFDKMNWDSARVFALDPKRFAVFGPEVEGESVAAALRAKGMRVAVNPPYEVVPFKREAGHGGTGPLVDRGKANFENIYAHSIVLPGHPLAQISWDRGHINRPVTPTFPGPGRAYVQWGVGGYQAGFENVWIFGDVSAGVSWLLGAIGGSVDAGEVTSVSARIHAPAPTAARPPRLPRRLTIKQEIALWDTPVGIDASPDGEVIYVLLAGGYVAAFDRSGRNLWNSTRAPLLQGGCLAASPRGDRVAVGGFPGLLVLDATNGKVLGGTHPGALLPDQSRGHSRMVAAAWNSEGTLVAGGGVNGGSCATPATGGGKSGVIPTFPLAILDANGAAFPAPGRIVGDVMGLAFVPRSSTLLIGADQLTAFDTTAGAVAWRADIGGAQSIRLSADGKTGAAGGWRKRAGSFDVRDGRIVVAADFPSNVGGTALSPGGEVAIAVWGGTHPLYRLDPSAPKPAVMAQARFGFHDVVWLERESAVLAAEEGGTIWLFDSKGSPRAKLEDAGTTAHRTLAHGSELLLGRMNRVVQRVVVS